MTESNGLYSVVVNVASSDASDPISQLYILTLIDRNDPTVWKDNPNGAEIAENITGGVSNLAVFAATDGDGADVNTTYRLSGKDAKYFELDKESGVLSTSSVFDHEESRNPRYTVSVRARSDDGSSPVNQTFILTVTNINEETTEWRDGRGYNASGKNLNENNNEGTRLAEFRAIDGDKVDINYSLAGTDAKYFSIEDRNGGVGRLFLVSSLDFEDAGHGTLYSAIVSASSTDESPAQTRLYVLTVNNVNETNYDDSAATWSKRSSGRNYNENTEGRVQDFAAKDSDGGGINYWLSGNDAGLFSLDSRNRLYVKQAFDYENPETDNADNRYTVVVNAQGLDGGTQVGDGALSLIQTYVLTIVDRDDKTEWNTNGNPTGATVSKGISIGENVGATFTAIDEDLTASGQTITYGLTGKDNKYFNIGKEDGVLTTKREFTDEDKSHYTVVVRAGETREGGGFSVAQTFVLTISGIENIETDWRGGGSYNRSGKNLNENNSEGTRLADFRAADGNGVDVTYSLTGTDATYFSIEDRSGGVGRLYLKSTLDFEDSNHLLTITNDDSSLIIGGTNTLYSVLVNATSADGSAAISQLYILTLTDGDDKTEWDTNGNPTGATASKSASTSTKLETFKAVDEDITTDSTATITYGLTGKDNKYFDIGKDNGELTVKRAFTDDTKGHYTVVVRAGETGEGGGFRVAQTFVLTIGDIADIDTKWRNGGSYNRSGRALNENNSEGTRLADFRATDGNGVDIDYSLTGTDAGFFNIEDRSGGVGRLYLKSSLNYEDKEFYSVVVNAEGVDNSTAISQLYILTLNNQNEADINDMGATWRRRSTGTRRNENEDPRQLTQFEARDADGPGISYWLSGDAANVAMFSIDTVGKLYTTQTFDAESADAPENNRYSIVVNALGTAGDDGGIVGGGAVAVTQVYILTVRNRNEFDSSWEANGNPSGNSKSEDIAIGVSLANFGAVDGDAAAVTYGLRGRHRDDSYFQIDKDTGVLTARKEFNFESKDHYTVIVRAQSNDGSGRLEQEFVLTVGNIDDVATTWRNGGSFNRSGRHLNENNEAGARIASFRATDGDEGATIDYSLKSGNDSNYFSIDEENGIGRLYLVSSMDYESTTHSGEQNYSVIVVASSSDGSADISQLYVLSVRDKNDPTVWTASPTGAALAENTDGGSQNLAVFAATDGSNDATYSITGRDKKYFDIDKASGTLSTDSTFNFEDKEHYTVTIRAKVGGAGDRATQTFVLTITDANDSPEWVRQRQPLNRRNETPDGEQTARIGEAIDGSTSNAVAGRQVAKYKAIDDDTDNDATVQITYSLTGDDNAYFSIDSNGRLFLTSNLDFEDTNRTDNDNTDNIYSVIIHATSTDDSPVAISNLFVLTLTDREESARWTTEPTGANFAEENAVGDSIAIINATDGDGDDVTYSIRSRYRDDKYFEINKDTGELTAASIFDFEYKEHYTVVVRARSSEGSGRSTDEQIFVLTILEEGLVNWETGGDPSSNEISENNSIGISLADFGASDAVGTATITYSLSGDDNDYFAINATTGVLTAKSAFDFENPDRTDGLYSVRVNATANDDGASIQQTFVLTINDIDNTTAFNAGANDLTISENNTVGFAADDRIDDFGNATTASGIAITYGLSGDAADYFSIAADTGWLFITSSLDFESQYGQDNGNLYSVIITANADNEGTAISQLFILSVDGFAEPTIWQMGGNPSGAILSENNTVGITVTDFNAIDGDGVVVTYSLSGADTAYFNIDTATGVLTANSIFDFENTNHGAIYSVVVNANSLDDSDGISQLYVLTITNTSEFPVAWENDGNPSGTALAENNTADVSLANFAATDGDLLAVTYSLTGTDATYFNLNADTGILTAKSIFNFEDVARYSVVINASSLDDSPVISQLFILTLNNVDEPTNWENNGNPVGNTINEGLAIGTSLAQFNAADVDNVDISYSVDPGYGDDSYFAINSTTGVLTATSEFDFENPDKTDGRYSVRVIADSDDASAAISQIFVLTITDVNNTTAFSAGGNGATIAENNVVGFAAANRIDDFGNDDAGATITYGVSGGDADYFSIRDEAGWLFVKSSFDYESDYGQANNNRYSVIITANANEEGDEVTRLFVLTVTDANDPTGWADDGNPSDDRILENNSIGTSLADFGATDGDGVAVTYSLSGADNAYFNIDATTGVLTAKSVFDYEDTTRTDKLYSVIITATATDDSAPLSQIYVLSIADIAEAITWQADGNPSGATNAENDIPTTALATFNAVDGDANVTLTYSLVAGDDADQFSIDAENGTLHLRSELDFENQNHQPFYSVTVSVSSSDGSPSITSLFVLTLANANEPTGWEDNGNPSGNRLEENNSIGISLADFGATDADGVAVTYSLSGNDNAYFNINTNTGVLTAKSSFDFEDSTHTDGFYSVIIAATAPDDGPAISQIYVLTITDVVEPTAWQANGNPAGSTLSENIAIGTSLADFGAIDGDGNTVTYGLRDHQHDDYFAINATTGVLTTISMFDFENPANDDNRYTVEVRAGATNDSASINQTFVLTIGDIDNTTAFTAGGNGLTISENNTVGFDAGDRIDDFGNAATASGINITYSLSGDAADYFSVAADTGWLFIKSTLDFESDYGQANNNRYSVIITANADNEGTAITQLYILSVDNINEPTTWVSYSTRFIIKWPENRALDTFSIGAFSAKDEDNSPISYYISGEWDVANYFSINSSGELSMASVFDFESQTGINNNNRYSLTIHAVTADGNDSISTPQPFIFTISDVTIGSTEAFTWNLGNSNNGGFETAENQPTGLLAGFTTTGHANITPIYSISGVEAAYFNINSIGRLYSVSSFDYESTYGQSINNRYSIVVTATDEDDANNAISLIHVLTITNLDEVYWQNNGNPTGGSLQENNAPGASLADFGATAESGDAVTYSLSALNANNLAYFNIDATTGVLMASVRFNYEDFNSQSRGFKYSVTINVHSTNDDSARSQDFILTITNVDDGEYIQGGGLAPDPTTPDQPVGWNGKILFDGDTDNLGGINDGIGNDGLIIIGDNLMAIQYDSVSATNTDLVLNNIENFADSFVGYTDADGNTQNHWFFVRDDAGDNTGHIVFDADGLDVNLDSLSQGGATTTPDQINLLAGLNFGNDGDFNKPDDLDLNLNGNQAASLTHDQFLALIGGSNNIDFI